jgi:biotin-dependent carboxylase-like uncharacterized protein
MHGPVAVRAGDELSLGVPQRGLRTYLAVRGGVDVPPVLGSRSTDLLSGLGPSPLQPHLRLAVGDQASEPPNVDVAPVPEIPEHVILTATPGPRDDWFTPSALTALISQPYQVTPQSNRVALRLTGPALERAERRELPSEGMVCGAVQVPPDGQPVLFLADHPVTGGYPVIAVVEARDVCIAAQVRPGQRLHIRLAGSVHRL